MFAINYVYEGTTTITGEVTLSGEKGEYKTCDILNHIAWELEDMGIEEGTGIIRYDNVVAPY